MPVAGPDLPNEKRLLACRRCHVHGKAGFNEFQSVLEGAGKDFRSMNI
jgi:hypothetical protein